MEDGDGSSDEEERKASPPAPAAAPKVLDLMGFGDTGGTTCVAVLVVRVWIGWICSHG